MAWYQDPVSGSLTPLAQYNASAPPAVPPPSWTGYANASNPGDLSAGGRCDWALSALDYLVLYHAGQGDVAYVLANVTFTSLLAPGSLA